MIETKVLIKLSALIDGLDLDLSILRSKNQEELGMKILSVLVRGLHKCETQTYELIAAYKGITVEEAAHADAIEIIKELLNDGGVRDFLA